MHAAFKSLADQLAIQLGANTHQSNTVSLLQELKTTLSKLPESLRVNQKPDTGVSGGVDASLLTSRIQEILEKSSASTSSAALLVKSGLQAQEEKFKMQSTANMATIVKEMNNMKQTLIDQADVRTTAQLHSEFMTNMNSKWTTHTNGHAETIKTLSTTFTDKLEEEKHKNFMANINKQLGWMRQGLQRDKRDQIDKERERMASDSYRRMQDIMHAPTKHIFRNAGGRGGGGGGRNIGHYGNSHIGYGNGWYEDGGFDDGHYGYAQYRDGGGGGGHGCYKGLYGRYGDVGDENHHYEGQYGDGDEYGDDDDGDDGGGGGGNGRSSGGGRGGRGGNNGENYGGVDDGGNGRSSGGGRGGRGGRGGNNGWNNGGVDDGGNGRNSGGGGGGRGGSGGSRRGGGGYGENFGGNGYGSNGRGGW